MTQKAKIRAIITLLVVALAYVVYANSLRRSATAIENTLLNMTPIGSSMADVQRAIVSRNLGVPEAYNAGLYKQKNPAKPEVVGVKHMQLHLGSYFSPPLFTTSVDAYWAFDGQGKLLDIWVWKTTDGL